LATIDLNALLYKYEVDISWAIRNVFNDELQITSPWRSPGQTADYVETSITWDRRAQARKERIDKFLWNEEKGMYFDYNTVIGQRSDYECATTFYALWSGLASPEQAAALVSKALPRFEHVGGLTVSTERSRGPIGPDRPQRQWDYPYGWAPHQILAWDGLRRYGYIKEMERLVYRWLHLLIRTIVDYNGTIAEKYDVTQLENSRRADAEYGNQGVAFKGIAKEG
jgi:alpha,alpha-trehalase